MKPVKLFEEHKPLTCAYCGKDLFKDPSMSIVVFISNVDTDETIDIYTCCKGECDERMKRLRRPKGFIDGWRDLSDFMNPILFLTQTMAIINNLYEGASFRKNAIESYKNILLSTAPYVMRQPTEEEERKAINASMLPF
jgi:hypothetical protein